MVGPEGGWRVRVPETRRERMRGLRGSLPLGPREAMLFLRCRSVQTFGMGNAISVAFLDGAMRVVELRRCRPGSSSGRGVATPATLSNAASPQGSRSAIGSDPHAEQCADQHGSEGGGTHDEQRNHPGCPARQRDRLTASPLGLDQSEPFQDHPKLALRHTTVSGAGGPPLSGCRSRRVAATLTAMGIPRPIVVLLVAAAACGGNADAGPAPGDYFAQLQRVSETAHIQERGLRRDLRVRLEEAPPGEDRKAVATVFVDQSARLYQDVLDALETLNPPSELVAVQQAFIDAWRAQLDLTVKVRDAGSPSADRILEQLESPDFHDAAARDEGRLRRAPGGRRGRGFRRGSRLRRPPLLTEERAKSGPRALAILSELSPMGRWRGAGPHRLAA